MCIYIYMYICICIFIYMFDTSFEHDFCSWQVRCDRFEGDRTPPDDIVKNKGHGFPASQIPYHQKLSKSINVYRKSLANPEHRIP